MYVLKGFISNAKFVSNEIGVVAPIGEISTQSLTYAREKGLYKSTLSSNIGLTTFISAQNEVPQTVTVDATDHIVTIAKFIYDRSIAVNGEIFADELLADLIVNYAAQAENFECGAIVNNGTIWMPEWVSWKNKSVPGMDLYNNLKVWFADESFRSQYDEYEIVVVPPVDNLDNFFQTAAQVRTMITALTPSENMIRVQAAKDGYPESIIRSETYNYIDPYNVTNKIPVTWTLLIYGAAGDNVDAVNDTLMDFIISNSTHTREEWILLMPDLFRRTEFILFPIWNQYAIPNRQIEAGIYSPITNLKRAITLIKQVVLNYPGTHIDDHVSIMGTPYKSLHMLTIGSVDNRNDIFELIDIFPDYIQEFSTSIDFNRMSQSTQAWVNLLAQMIITAETMGRFSSVPLGMTKVMRNDVLYLVKRYGNINYLMVAKGNFPEESVA
jgi:hypothetical protein